MLNLTSFFEVLIREVELACALAQCWVPQRCQFAGGKIVCSYCVLNRCGEHQRQQQGRILTVVEGIDTLQCRNSWTSWAVTSYGTGHVLSAFVRAVVLFLGSNALLCRCLLLDEYVPQLGSVGDADMMLELYGLKLKGPICHFLSLSDFNKSLIRFSLLPL